MSSISCRKIGQSQPKVTIYTNFVELESLVLHATFQGHRTFGSGEKEFKTFWSYMGMAAIFVICPRLSLQTLRSLFPRRLHIKFGLDWPSGFREKMT